MCNEPAGFVTEVCNEVCNECPPRLCCRPLKKITAICIYIYICIIISVHIIAKPPATSTTPTQPLEGWGAAERTYAGTCKQAMEWNAQYTTVPSYFFLLCISLEAALPSLLPFCRSRAQPTGSPCLSVAPLNGLAGGQVDRLRPHRWMAV